MSTEDFEDQLRRVPMREVPAGWRGEILGERMRDEGGRRKGNTDSAQSWWRDLLWPSPLAWGALACVWVVIAAANADWRREQPRPAVVSVTPEAIMMRLAQERSLSENKGMF